MAVTYVGAGSVAGANSGTTFQVTGPAIQAKDLLVCAAISFLAGGPTPATIDGNWKIGASFTFGNRSCRVFWRKAVSSDSEKTWTITKGSPSTESHAVVFAFRGSNAGVPIDPAGFKTASVLSAQETVTFPQLAPSFTTVHVVAIALYFQDETDFSTPPSGFDLHLDVEGATGTGATFAVASLAGDGSAVTPGNWASNSVTDGFWGSVVFGINTNDAIGGGGLNRRRRRQG